MVLRATRVAMASNPFDIRRYLRDLDGIAPAKRGRRLPVVLSVGEVRQLLAHMRGVSRLCATLMYGSGLRLGECVSLRVKDVDLVRKGGSAG